MHLRKGFETALEDIKKEFSYLEIYGFVSSGETLLPDRVSLGYKGNKYDILLAYEFIEENFDFNLIEARDPHVHRQFWKIIQDHDPGFDYRNVKPQNIQYKKQLKYMAKRFENVLPLVLSDSYNW